MEGMPESSRLWAELLDLGSDDGDYDGDRAQALAAELNRRGEPEVVVWALPMLSDPDLWHRKAAAWVLGQHGFIEGRPFGAQVMPALAAAARTERDDETRSFLVTALGHGEDPAWVEELLAYAADPYGPIREGVARSLPIMFAGDPMDATSIATLVVLTRDPDRTVRDWATMGLAGETGEDSDVIRAALVERLDDTEDDDDQTATSGEAALGLALRHDSRVYPYLERWLSAPPSEIGNLIVEAAGELGDPRLLPALRALRATDWQELDPRPEVLDDAITALAGVASDGAAEGSRSRDLADT